MGAYCGILEVNEMNTNSPMKLKGVPQIALSHDYTDFPIKSVKSISHNALIIELSLPSDNHQSVR